MAGLKLHRQLINRHHDGERDKTDDQADENKQNIFLRTAAVLRWSSFSSPLQSSLRFPSGDS
jgi:hypothetical protein